VFARAAYGTFGSNVPAMLRAVLKPLYDYAWFVGFFLSSALYYLLMLRFKPLTAT
jgi:cytosine/uracil/thiamine/allantoin permease